MRRSARINVLAGLAALIATPALAAAQLPGIGIGIAAGANVPTADYADATKEGLVLNGFVELRTSSALGVRGSLFWSRSDMDNPLITSNRGVTLPDDPSYNVTGDVDLIGASLDLTLGPSLGTIRPYVVGGVGVFQRRVSQDVEGAVEEFRDLRRNDTDVGFNGGLGVRLSLGGTAVFAEARYYSVATEPGRTNFVPVVIGLAF
ncbi:MAG: outer membrane beta-barrel protein [Gemmatimonadaceae bacterium]